jgi:hypothetical protein
MCSTVWFGLRLALPCEQEFAHDDAIENGIVISVDVIGSPKRWPFTALSPPT